MIRHVPQRQPRGCGVACAAMILGLDYDVAAQLFPERDLDGKGIYWPDIDAVIKAHGYTVRRIFLRDSREAWPPEPFAPVHLCEVVVYRGAPCTHHVVMLADGAVFDPLTTEPRRLSDYFAVWNVRGVTRSESESEPCA